jgi:hypothetical protein
LKADSDPELKKKYKEIYISTYLRSADGDAVIIHDWLGNRILFDLFTFDHAFSEGSDYRFGDGVHDIPFSQKRARRVLWIKEVLAASGCTVERRHQIVKDSRGRRKKRRVLIVLEEKYVVVLEETGREKELRFITAFPADIGALNKIRSRSGLVEIKNPSLNGD